MFLPSHCPGCGVLRVGRCVECARSLALVASSRSALAPLVHVGPPRQMVLGLKYRNARQAASALALAIARSVNDPGLLDVVTWAPTSARRIADRGYDPAEVLARAVADLLGLPCRRMLHRGRKSSPQAGKNRSARLIGPQFVAKPLWRNPRVLLIDDVTTTGATLREGASALLSVGAASVQCLAATATPSSG
ncbi:MAG: hypothetical protein F2873_09045 [Actinobacteria bacterium]|nr:hypothetical protein [Actinomycetota bacterium]MSX79289.1 hypothetical protein [Actinomycetota bacterium]